jgi:folate-binding protein YgfZ
MVYLNSNERLMQINNRELTTIHALAIDLAKDPLKNRLFDLSYLRVASLQGALSRDFLQGQLTCDVRDVNPQHMRQGALCNLKGRVLMLMDIVEWRGFHFILPEDLLDRSIRLLEKPAAFSRVTVHATPEYAVLGFELNNIQDIQPLIGPLPTARFEVTAFDGGCCYALGDGAFILLILLIDAPLIETIAQPFIDKHQWHGALAWHQTRLQHGQFEIYPESSGLFLPHRLDLHQSGQLNFNKGCYKGQEIIARTHYRATLKHTMKKFKLTGPVSLRSGLKLFQASSSIEIGELIDYSPLNDHEWIILASIFFEHANTITLEGHPENLTLEAL